MSREYKLAIFLAKVLREVKSSPENYVEVRLHADEGGVWWTDIGEACYDLRCGRYGGSGVICPDTDPFELSRDLWEQVEDSKAMEVTV